ncbi:ATP-NAD kinase [Ceratobasidium sp. AG-I]|nr:ATP-NAD kinase [Ceratobasidium sp. AG-I]
MFSSFAHARVGACRSCLHPCVSRTKRTGFAGLLPGLRLLTTQITSQPLRSRVLLSDFVSRDGIKRVLLCRKPKDEAVAQALDLAVEYIKKRFENVTMFVEASSKIPVGVEPYHPRSADRPEIDLIITLGGDGTILHASSLFNTGPVPPVLSFSMGTLGFLLPFHINSFPTALDDVFSGTATVLPRMRLACTFHDQAGKVIDLAEDAGVFKPLQVMNEITLHRGRSPHLTIIDAFVDDAHLTEAVSDGLIVSTPTGSTAYSLSSGGPIVHPSVQALILTPVCPRSLSFRPLLLPSSSAIRLTINPKSRAPAEVSMDGQTMRTMHVGESVQIATSAYPIPSINRSSPACAPDADEDDGFRSGASQDNWVRDINNLLQFNASFKNSAILFGKELG